jgi:uracil-DNA glycosylase
MTRLVKNMKQQVFAFEKSQPEVNELPKVDYDYPTDRAAWSGLALIGEAPGAEEVRLGHPFVGRSGQLLDKMLAEAGIDRKRCFVGNVFRFQPPGNKVDHFFISRRAAAAQNLPISETYGQFGSAWCRSEYAAEIDHLRATLGALKPRAIIALGRTPFWALTGLNGLLDKVGQNLPCRFEGGTPVIPTYHPSFILRGNWGLQGKWLQHFLAAKEKTI